MVGKYLSIGDMAKINHTTVPTLRLYDKCGLLVPVYTDPETRYRYYDIKQNARFDMIRYMKELGMGLAEIKEIFDRKDLNEIESMLIRRREQTLRGIEQMKIQRDAISRTISDIERYRKSPRPGTITLEYIPERRIHSMRVGVNFYEHDIDTYELILKQLEDDIINHNLPPIYYHNAGTFLKKEDFLVQRYVSDRIFVFIDEHCMPETPGDESGTAGNGSPREIIESGMYACIYADDFDEEQDYARRLLEYCRANDYQVIGDYICEVLTELNIFDCSRRSMFLRLQVPVSFQK
jgi:DNA-binding transcriptional MerR regulator